MGGQREVKILHVINQMDPKTGGVCQAVRATISGLEELGISNEVVSLDDSDASYIKNEKFRIHTVGSGVGPWSYSTKLTPWLVKNLSNYEVIVLHGLWLFPNYALQKAMLRFIKFNAKTVLPKVYVMPHGMLDPYFQNIPGRRLKSIRNWLYWKLIEAKIINTADGILFTSEQERILARIPFSPYLPKQEVVVGLGVNEPPTFNAAMSKSFLKACPQVKDKPYFLFLSRIHEKKGVDLLVEAYLQLREELLNEELPFLVIAGPGMETEYGQNIEKLVSQNKGLEDSVFFPGMLTGDAKWGAFYGCEAFVLPSHQENFGIAVVEAMACKKAVLISDQVNIWREIELHDGGIIKKNDVNGCKSLLETWVSLSKIEKQKIEINARNCFESNFGIIPNAIRLKELVLNR